MIYSHMPDSFLLVLCVLFTVTKSQTRLTTKVLGLVFHGRLIFLRGHSFPLPLCKYSLYNNFYFTVSVQICLVSDGYIFQVLLCASCFSCDACVCWAQINVYLLTYLLTYILFIYLFTYMLNFCDYFITFIMQK